MTDHGTPSGEGGDLDAVGGELRESELTRKLRTATGSQLDTCGAKLELPRVRSMESDGYSLAGYIESDTDYRGRLLAKSERDSQTQADVVADDGAPPIEDWDNVPPNVECITVDQLHAVHLEVAVGTGHGNDDLANAWNRALDTLIKAARPHFVERHDPQSLTGWALPKQDSDELSQVPTSEPEQVLDVPMSFDGESVAQLLVAFGLSKADAAVAVRLAALPEAIDEAGRRADEAAQEAVDYTIEAKRLRAVLAREVQDAKPSIVEAFARMVPGVQS